MAISPPCYALCCLELLLHRLVLLPWPMTLLPCCARCCFELPCCLKLHCCVIAWSCLLLPLPLFASNYFDVSPLLHRYLSLLFLALLLVASLPQATSHCFASFLPHSTLLLGYHCTQGIFWPPPSFVVLVPRCLTPCCLVTLLPCVGWYFLPLIFWKEELGAWRSKLSSNQRRLIYFFVST